MGLPTRESIEKFLSTRPGAVRERVLAIARRLEALKEYSSEQALIVAADIVMHSMRAPAPAPAATGNSLVSS